MYIPFRLDTIMSETKKRNLEDNVIVVDLGKNKNLDNFGKIDPCC